MRLYFQKTKYVIIFSYKHIFTAATPSFKVFFPVLFSTIMNSPYLSFTDLFILFFPCATLLVLLQGSRAALLQHTCLESSRLVNVPVMAALCQLWDIWSLCFDASNVRYILYDSQSHCATNSGNFVVLCGKYDCSHWYTHKSRFGSVFERSSSLYWYPQTRIMITTSVIIGGYLSELFLQFQ